MNLKLRFSLFAGFLVIASGLAVWGASRQLAEEIIGAWAARYAERQVLYDKARTLQPLMREIALARQLASSPQIKDWARRPEEAEARRRGLAELESFRGNFAEHNYFLGLVANGAYYHNNGANEYAGRELRYTLAPKKASDRWFFDVIHQGRDIHINVNPDAELGVTKLWIDILVRDGNDILGVAGTGLDLTPFLREVVDNSQPGISNLFVDHDGAIQLFREQGLIDFASITKGDGEHRTLDLLFDRPDDRQALRAAMKEVEAPGTSVISRIVHRGDKRYIAGIAYLPELGWYDVTLMDLEVILPVSTFRGIFLVYGVTLLFAIFLFNWVLGRLVLRPLKHLEKAVVAVRDGRFVPDALTPGGQDEMGSLLRHFKSMAEDVERSRQELEAKVMERTEGPGAPDPDRHADRSSQPARHARAPARRSRPGRAGRAPFRCALAGRGPFQADQRPFRPRFRGSCPGGGGGPGPAGHPALRQRRPLGRRRIPRPHPGLRRGSAGFPRGTHPGGRGELPSAYRAGRSEPQRSVSAAIWLPPARPWKPSFFTPTAPSTRPRRLGAIVCA